jgi:hypothetical protein
MKFIALLILSFSSISQGALVLPNINLPTRPTIPMENYKNQICQQSCVDGVLKMNFQLTGEASGEKKCPSQAAAPDLTFSCGGYVCARDGKNCLVACDTKENCSNGYDCENRKCIPERPISYFCSSNEVVASSKGESWSCSPMICQAGRCKDKCVTTNDCVAGAVCDTSNGSCVFVR